MGNFCMYMDKDYEGKIKCNKCGDRYIPHYGLKSKRTSCRAHRFELDNIHLKCKDCQLIKGTSSRNCFHCYT